MEVWTSVNEASVVHHCHDKIMPCVRTERGFYTAFALAVYTPPNSVFFTCGLTTKSQ